ncbi:helix-turn-helix domain-containing protein [Plantibacter sp. YIM 135249]|uniref:helix-turn-helix domain-containing protein n=1 Tax=Plantibacter sp. YIM 135249 TaxID=3423918 RepID=UPI003D34C43E
MSDTPSRLGDYLRARRELVTPVDVGIPVLGVRRVPGLRREEVAMLAGISADYYLRLEQGRDRNPSVQVLESIARVLQLDDDTTTYLLGLAVEKPRRTKRARKETVPAGIAQLIAALPLPAFAEGRYLDVLAANPLAAALSPRLIVGGNRLRDVFLDPEERALFPDWERATEGLIAGFRQSVGTDTDDPRFVELVGELSIASPRFRQLWARHDVATRRGATMRFAHPVVGELHLHREKLVVGGNENIVLAVYHADPGSIDAEKLAILSSLTAPPTVPTAVRDRRLYATPPSDDSDR